MGGDPGGHRARGKPIQAGESEKKIQKSWIVVCSVAPRPNTAEG